MSRLLVPLLYRTLYASGDVLVRAELDLRLKDDSGTWKPATFRVDSATEMTTMPASLARKLGLPIPLNPVPHAIRTQTGMEFRSGFLRVQVVGMDATEYVFPCFLWAIPTLRFRQRPRPTSRVVCWAFPASSIHFARHSMAIPARKRLTAF